MSPYEETLKRMTAAELKAEFQAVRRSYSEAVRGLAIEDDPDSIGDLLLTCATHREEMMSICNEQHYRSKRSFLQFQPV